MERVKIGVVGCGVIANSVYLRGIKQMPEVEMVAVCDLIEERARAASEDYSVPAFYTDLATMLAESDIDMVVNLTNIQAHFETNLLALQAGKHVYTEKTMTTTVVEATRLIEEAREQQVLLGAAAATMLSAANQKVGQLIRAGAIGKVCFVVAHHSHGGAASFEGWTTDPTWFYKPGAGPMLDLGVYDLHTLTGLLGPAKTVTAVSGISIPKRTVRSGPAKDKVIDVEVDDNTLLLLDFGDATFAFLDATYCVRDRRGPRMEFYGSEGTINVNDRGAVAPLSVYRDDRELGLDGWMDLEMRSAPRWSLVSGVEHLADCIRNPGCPVITTGEHARHVIEIINQGYVAAHEGRTMVLETTF
ncbi:MAG: Gfo/Idh/MocA family oxidoreductase [Anaerolineae bacterium]|nr:Gfo/Idh/MocA family oxidoreductase [Anaerolineae bacterium]